MMLIEVIQDLCALFGRALTGKKFFAFGEDGCGRFGRSSIPLECTIREVFVNCKIDENGKTVGGIGLYLNEYDESTYGLMTTDQNALIGVRALLAEHHIDPTCLSWHVGQEFVAAGHVVWFDVDVDLALDWA